jgi:hypothetical protein
LPEDHGQLVIGGIALVQQGKERGVGDPSRRIAAGAEIQRAIARESAAARCIRADRRVQKAQD